MNRIIVIGAGQAGFSPKGSMAPWRWSAPNPMLPTSVLHYQRNT